MSSVAFGSSSIRFVCVFTTVCVGAIGIRARCISLLRVKGCVLTYSSLGLLSQQLRLSRLPRLSGLPGMPVSCIARLVRHHTRSVVAFSLLAPLLTPSCATHSPCCAVQDPEHQLGRLHVPRRLRLSQHDPCQGGVLQQVIELLLPELSSIHPLFNGTILPFAAAALSMIKL